MIGQGWQIALAVLVGVLIGTLCTYVACRLAGDRGQGAGDSETVGADADGQASGAPQGRPSQASGDGPKATGDR